MSLLGFVFAVLIIGLLWWALTSLIAAFKLEDPLATVVKVAFVLAALYFLLSEFFTVLPPLRLR